MAKLDMPAFLTNIFHTGREQLPIKCSYTDRLTFLKNIQTLELRALRVSDYRHSHVSSKPKKNKLI